MTLLRDLLQTLAYGALLALLLWSIGACAGLVVVGFRMIAG